MVKADFIHIRLRSPLLRALSTPFIDSALWAVSLTLFTFFRYSAGFSHTFTDGLAEIVGMAVALQLGLGLLSQLYLVKWRIASFEEILALAGTVAGVTGVLLALTATTNRHPIPTSAVIAAGCTALVATGASRTLWRVWLEKDLRPAPSAQRAVVLGMGEAGMQLLESLLRTPDSPYLPVALLDDDPAKRRLRIRHLRVWGGLDDLQEVASKTGAQALIVAIPSADSQLMRRVSSLAGAAQIEVRVLPPVNEILGSKVDSSSIRPLDLTDLLGRRVIETDVQSVSGYITGKRVLVTGAGGSIGSELCRQLAKFHPEGLVMLDRDESALHAVQLSIEGNGLLQSRNLVLCNIREAQVVKEVFSEHRPDVVFHAAALKHLPLLEMWPAEAVKNNVIGTQNVIDAALSTGVSRFVNISTDKAANPTSVLGMTKRIAERLTAGAAERGAGVYLSVRFGNVLGSRGSVLHAFREQIAAGGPVTVTHPDVTRFFMTVGEAVELVIQAGAIGSSGEVLVLDMGEPVRIRDVAQQLIDVSGRAIAVEYSGLRDGEKLHEDLFGVGETESRRSHPLISHVTVPPIETSVLDHLQDTTCSTSAKDDLRRVCRSGDSRVGKEGSRMGRSR